MYEFASQCKQLHLRCQRYQSQFTIDLSQFNIIDCQSVLYDSVPDENNELYDINSQYDTASGHAGPLYQHDTNQYISQTITLEYPGIKSIQCTTQYRTVNTLDNNTLFSRSNKSTGVKFANVISESLSIDSIKLYSKQQYNYSTQKYGYKYYYCYNTQTKQSGQLNKSSIYVLNELLTKFKLSCTVSNLYILYIITGYEYLFHLYDVQTYIQSTLLKSRTLRYITKQHMKLIMYGTQWITIINDEINEHAQEYLSKRDVIDVCNIIVQYIPVNDYILMYADNQIVLKLKD